MNGINELLTVAKYWRRGRPAAHLPGVDNNDLNEVTWEMRVMEGNPKYRSVARSS